MAAPAAAAAQPSVGGSNVGKIYDVGKTDFFCEIKKGSGGTKGHFIAPQNDFCTLSLHCPPVCRVATHPRRCRCCRPATRRTRGALVRPLSPLVCLTYRERVIHSFVYEHN